MSKVTVLHKESRTTEEESVSNDERRKQKNGKRKG
jgi:hypothetical protein